MRKTVRSYIFAFSLIAVMAVSASANPHRSDDPDVVTRVKNFIAWAFEELKVSLPPG